MIPLLMLLSSAYAAPTISNCSVQAKTWSTARLRWDTSGATGSYSVQRVRIGTATGVYTKTIFQRDLNVPRYEMSVSGMDPSTTYFAVCETSDDNSATWGTSSEVSFTTNARGSAFPTPPTDWTSSYPDTTGAAVTASSCATIQADINSKYPLTATQKQVLTLPAAGTCVLTSSLTTPTDANAKPFTSANVNDATDTFTVTGTAFSENQEIVFGTTGCLPTADPTSPDAFCQFRGAIVRGYKYYAVSVSGTSFKVAKTSGGAAIDIPTGLTGTGTSYVMPWTPVHSNELIIRTSATDAELPPAGVLDTLNLVFAGKLARLVITGGTNNSNLGCIDFGMGAHHIRLVGIECTHSDASGNLTGSTDPRPTYHLMNFAWSNALAYITIDRCWIHGLSYPNRLFRAFPWDGRFISIENSVMNGWDYWRPGKTGWGVTFTDPTITIASGTYKLDGATSCTSSGLTFTRTNGTNGTAKIYLVKSTCAATLQAPTGSTWTCTGTTSLNGGAPVACAITNAASPAYPLDALGGHASGPLVGVTIAGGVITAAADEYGAVHPSIYLTEGTQAVIAGSGPGPWKLQGNYIEGAGLLWHWDDGFATCEIAGQACPESAIIRRNTFVTPTWARTNGAGSQGLRYMQRNGYEFKNTSKVLISGNIFRGFFSEVSSTGCMIVISPVGGRVTDFQIEYNTAEDGSCFLLAIGGLPTLNTGGFLGTYTGFTNTSLARTWVRQNLVRGINGYTFYEPQYRGSAVAFPFYLGFAIEDLIIDHNTIYDHRGPNPRWLHWIANQSAGVVATNNILWGNNDDNSYGVALEVDARNNPNCSGSTTIKDLLDCRWQQGFAASYTFANNLYVPGYTDSSVPSGNVSVTTAQTQYAGLGATVQTGTDAPARTAAVKFVSSTTPCDLRYDSSYKSGGATKAADGTDIGVDCTALKAAQGTVENARALNLGGTPEVHWFAYDGSYVCSVDWSTDAFSTWTRVAGSAATDARVQHAVLTGAPATGTVAWRVLCQASQPTGSFTR